jgi:membrane protease subunit HflK
MKSGAWIFTLLGLTAGLAAASGIRVVQPGEQMVIRRFGRLVEPSWGPGLHWGLPFGFDRFDRVRTDEVRRLNVGLAESITAADLSAGEFLTGDLNLVRVRAVVQFHVDRPRDYVLQSGDVETLLVRRAEASLARALSRREIDPVLRVERRGIAGEMERDLKETINREHLGVAILDVSLVETRPPNEVAPDFAEAQSAESRRDGRVRDASTQAEATVASAQATARARLERARGEADRLVLSSRAQARRFVSLLTQARSARTLTLHRMYLDSLRALLANTRRKVVVPDGEEVDLTVLGVQD